jgi:hypothetical protein
MPRNNPFGRRLLSIGFGAVSICLLAPTAESVQLQKPLYASTESNGMKKKAENLAEESFPKKGVSLKNPSRAPLSPARQLEANKITSLFVRANDSKRIQFSVLITYKDEFTRAVRELIGEEVTPLLFSVSTLPTRTAHFEPALLRFEQRGRSWQPSPERNAIDIWPWEEGGAFGGPLTDAQVQQGVILLPAWFDPQAPITLRYGDFRYLARFVEQQ